MTCLCGDPACPSCGVAQGTLEECACGRTYEPVDGNGEDVDMCQTCRENAAVVAYERSLDSYYGGGAPVTIEEQHNAAWEEKRGAR